VERIANYVRRAFATVRHRHDVNLGFGQNLAESDRDIVGHFARAERAFEFIRRYKDLHGATKPL
jgi:hypothetical protein